MQEQENLHLPLLLDQDEDGIWVAESPIFDGFFTQGYSKEELQDNLQDLSNMYFAMIKEWKKPFKHSYLISLQYNKDGKITNDLKQEIDQTFEKKMIWAC